MSQPESSRGLKSVAARNAISAVLARSSTLVVGLILTPFVLNRIGAELYGVLVAAGAAYEYLSLLRGGMGAALRRYVTLAHHSSQHEEATRHYAVGFWLAAILRTFILLVAVLIAGAICRFVRLPEHLLRDGAAGVALILAAAVVTDAAATQDIPIYATGRTAKLGVIQALRGWLRLGVTLVAFSLLVPSLTVYGGGLVVTEFVPLLLLVWMGRRTGVVRSVIPRPQLGDREIRRKLFQYGGVALLLQAATLLYLATDNLLIGRIFGAASVTHYSLGARWSPLILAFLVTSISSIVPLFTQLEAHGESERSREALTRIVAITASLAIPFCLVPCVVGDIFLVQWVGSEYVQRLGPESHGSAAYMLALLIPTTLEVALSPISMVLLGRGRIGWIATGEIIAALGKVGLGLVLALPLGFGLLGFALGTTVALVVKNLVVRLLAIRGDPAFPSAWTLLLPLPRALAGGAPALIALYLLRGVYDGGLAQVMVAGIAGGVLCLAGSALVAMRPRGIAELLRTLRSAWRPEKADGPPADTGGNRF